MRWSAALAGRGCFGKDAGTVRRPRIADERHRTQCVYRDAGWLSARLPRPKAVCVVAAHWVTTGARVLSSAHPKTIPDFYGFPRPLYEVQYPAPGAPDEAKEVVRDPEIAADDQWGLDHGSWSVLRHMYPQADVPAFQLSLDERRSFKEHLELGHEIQSLRERGFLILGSGNIVHHLSRMVGTILRALTTGQWSLTPRSSQRSWCRMRIHWPNLRSGATPFWPRRIRASSTTCHSCIAWAARTNATECRIPMKGLTSPASRCG